MPFISVSGTELYYIQSGDGPNVVLVHGLASNLAFWYTGIVLPLRSQYRVTAYDLRGHGKSGVPPTGYTHVHMADDLLALVDHLKLERFHLVGHSYGGLVSLSFALRHPKRLSSLTLADVPIDGLSSDWTSCWPELLNKLPEMATRISKDDPYAELQILEELARSQVRSQLKGVTPNSTFSPFGWGKGSKKTVKRWLQLLNDTTAREDFRSRELSIRDFLKIETPTLVTYGIRSKWKSSGDILREHLPNSKIVYVEGAGHAHPWERPGDFLRGWLEFIASVDKIMPYSGIERRMYNRQEICIRLDLWVGKGDLYPVKTVNISIAGILVLCPRPMEMGSEVEFLPVNREDGQSDTVKGRIVRRGGELPEKEHRFGIEILREDQSSQVLADWIRGYTSEATEMNRSVSLGNKS